MRGRLFLYGEAAKGAKVIVFSDMDGTLLSSDNRITPATVEMLDVLHENGIEFVPCTGRPLMGVPRELLAHPAVNYVVCSGGTSVAELSDVTPAGCMRMTTIMCEPLRNGVAERIWSFARDLDVTFEAFVDGDCLMPSSMYDRLDEFSQGDSRVADALRAVHTPVDGTPEQIMARPADVERVILYWRNAGEGETLGRFLKTMPGIAVVSSYPNNFEITRNDVSKGTAIRWLCGHLGISVTDSYGFGDSSNDLGMFEAVGHACAMKNATTEVKAVADAVTEFDNDHDGVARAVLSLM